MIPTTPFRLILMTPFLLSPLNFASFYTPLSTNYNQILQNPNRQNMSLLRHVIKSPTIASTHRLFFLNVPKHFSTAAEQRPSSDDFSVDPFLKDTSGLVYGRLQGITRHTLKTDILNLLQGYNLRSDDIKVSYTNYFVPIEMLIKFPSRDAYNAAFKAIGRKGRLFKLEKAEQSQWDIIMPFNGKTVLLHGLPRNVFPEDIERFLAGCEYDSSSMEIMTRQGFPQPVKVALVRFPSHIAATNAFITKNRGFFHNNQVTMRVLE